MPFRIQHSLEWGAGEGPLGFSGWTGAGPAHGSVAAQRHTARSTSAKEDDMPMNVTDPTTGEAVA